MIKFYINKLKFKEGLDCFVCLSEKIPLYSARTIGEALKFAGVYLNKMDVKEFRIIYKEVCK